MSSELKLSLENFQSIRSGELVFHKGLNFIIGQSNSGKSATFRALKACLINPTGSQRYIKKGSRKASVKLEYNGNQIIWNRTPKESSYTINGEDFLKTGKSNAFKILDGETGFAKDDNDNIMNIEEELQLPFPFGFSKTDLFKLYENVFCISDSAAVLKGMKNQEDGIKNEVAQLELDLNKSNLKLTELNKFKEEVDLKKLKKVREILISKRDSLVNLKEGLPIIKKAVLASTVKYPEEKEFNSLLSVYTEKLDVKSTIQRVKKYHVFLKTSFSKVEVVNKLSDYNELKGLKKDADTLNKLSNVVLPEIKVEELLSSYKEKQELRKTYEQLRKLDLQVFVKEFPSHIQELEELKRFKEQLANIVTRGKELQVKYKNQLKKVEQLQAQLREYKVCPLCYSPLEGECKC